MSRRSHSLAEVAETYLPAEWVGGARWLAHRINSGELKGHRFGRVLVMTDSDVAYMLDKFAVTAEPGVAVQETPDTDLSLGLSERARRRLKTVS